MHRHQAHLESKVLGFTNSWYDFALRTANYEELIDGTLIKIVSAPAFIASKLEAFNAQGNADFYLSHDLEDIISVIDGRPRLPTEIENTEEIARTYISKTLAKMLVNPDFRVMKLVIWPRHSTLAAQDLP